jgi:hypothetical protein
MKLTHMAARLVPVLLFLFAAPSIGHCEAIGIPQAATSQVSTAIGTDYGDQWYWQCCTGTRFSMFADPQTLELQVETDLRDRDGLKRDTWYFLGYQVATIGILYMMPEGVSGWTEEQKEEYSLSIWWEHVTNPTWDSDDDYINYLLHPYWGAAYFVRARERGYDNKQAFWYSVLLSSMYEFGVEALFEEPSIQDLIVTPVFGSWLGTYFMRVRGDIREHSATRGYRTTKEKWVWVLTDPLGSLNSMFDNWFGWEESQLQIRPYLAERRSIGNSPFNSFETKKDRVVGLQFSFEW